MVGALTHLLRDVEVGDLPVLFEHQRDPEANRMAAFRARERGAFVAHWTTKVLPDPAVRKKAIVDGEGRVAGNVVSFEQEGRRMVGYWLGREHWGKGLATAALAEFLAGETARPLFAIVAKHNVGSRRVLEKCGFTVDADLGWSDDAGAEEYRMKLERP